MSAPASSFTGKRAGFLLALRRRADRDFLRLRFDIVDSGCSERSSKLAALPTRERQ